MLPKTQLHYTTNEKRIYENTEKANRSEASVTVAGCRCCGVKVVCERVTNSDSCHFTLSAISFVTQPHPENTLMLLNLYKRVLSVNLKKAWIIGKRAAVTFI